MAIARIATAATMLLKLNTPAAAGDLAGEAVTWGADGIAGRTLISGPDGVALGFIGVALGDADGSGVSEGLTRASAGVSLECGDAVAAGLDEGMTTAGRLFVLGEGCSDTLSALGDGCAGWLLGVVDGVVLAIGASPAVVKVIVTP